jgi:charged multivesicular body protein 1
MANVVRGMDKAMESMNLERISMVMDKFEGQFNDLDVQTSYMESTMSDTTALTTPQDQVDSLINQVADEAGLEIQHGLGEAKVPTEQIAAPAQTEAPMEEDGRLAERLRALRPAV